MFEYLLRLGDNALVLGQRLSEWCGHGPVLEEDMALANVALDLLGQAQLWLSLAGEVEGAGPGRGQARLSARRPRLPQPAAGRAAERRFRRSRWRGSSCSTPGTTCCLRELHRSTDTRIAEIAAKAVKEVAYHLERSGDWVVRLGDGTEESHRRMQTAVDMLWMYTGEMFEMDEVDDALLRTGVAADLAPLARALARSSWARCSRRRRWSMPPPGWAQRGGKRGLHTEHLGYLLAEMQFLQRAYPGATW